MKAFFLISLFSIGSHIAFAQNNADTLFNMAESFFDKAEYDSASFYYDQAKPVFESNQNWGKAIESLRHSLSANIQLDNYEKNRERESEILSLSSRTELEKSSRLAESFYFLAYSYEKKGAFNKALSYYENAIEIFEATEAKGAYLVLTYLNAGQIATKKLDYPKAIEYLQKGLNDPSKYKEASMCGQLANIYFYLGRYEDQYKYIQRGLNADYSYQTLTVLGINEANYYYQKKEFQKAKKSILENMQYYEKRDAFWDKRIAAFIIMAEIYQAEGVGSKTDFYYEKAEEEAKKSKTGKNRNKASLYVNIAEYHLKNNHLDRSLEYFQKALIQLFPEFDHKDIAENPDIASVYPESWIMDAAAGKARALKKRFEKNGNIKDLEVAGESYQFVIATINQLNQSYQTEASKIYLGDYGYNYFEEAIDIQYLLYELTADQQYQEAVFSLMERSKAVVLSETIQKNKAIIEATIPDSLLNIEKHLRNAVAEKNIQLIKDKQSGVGKDETDLIELELTDLRNKYQRHLFALKKAFPKFQSLTEAFNPPVVQEVQAYLANQSTIVIEYFTGDKNIYALVIAAEEVRLHKIENADNTNELISEFLSFLKNTDQFINDPKAYYKTGHQLYLNLFPGLSHSKISFENIIIIPDGALKRMPFEALVDQPGISQINNYDHYLLNKYLIYFSNSAHLMLSANSDNKGDGHFLNVAPGFMEKERGLAPLLHSQKEVESLGSIRSLKGKAATLERFKEMVENGQVIHLSTHATAGSNGEIPKIEFIDSTLFLPAIYALNLKADLVVLSACESQLGELKKGEGILSLGRGFFYAGASSVVASLWRVKEQSTAEIFNEFYKQLKLGVSKAEALRQAKLHYLKNVKSDLKRTPYHWAGLIYLGNDEVLELPTERQYSKIGWYMIAGVCLLGLVFFLNKFWTGA